MSKTMRAKFKVESVKEFDFGSKEAHLRAVYSDGEPENNQFAEATPNGEITIMVDQNAEAKDFLQPGQFYYVDFTLAE